MLETKPNPLINRILVVDALEEQQIARAKSRDRLSESDIQAVIGSQVSREHRLERADDIIVNHGTINELAQQVEKLHHYYLSLPQA